MKAKLKPIFLLLTVAYSGASMSASLDAYNVKEVMIPYVEGVDNDSVERACKAAEEKLLKEAKKQAPKLVSSESHLRTRINGAYPSGEHQSYASNSTVIEYIKAELVNKPKTEVAANNGHLKCVLRNSIVRLDFSMLNSEQRKLESYQKAQKMILDRLLDVRRELNEVRADEMRLKKNVARYRQSVLDVKFSCEHSKSKYQCLNEAGRQLELKQRNRIADKFSLDPQDVVVRLENPLSAQNIVKTESLENADEWLLGGGMVRYKIDVDGAYEEKKSRLQAQINALSAEYQSLKTGLPQSETPRISPKPTENTSSSYVREESFSTHFSGLKAPEFSKVYLSFDLQGSQSSKYGEVQLSNLALGAQFNFADASSYGFYLGGEFSNWKVCRNSFGCETEIMGMESVKSLSAGLTYQTAWIELMGGMIAPLEQKPLIENYTTPAQPYFKWAINLRFNKKNARLKYSLMLTGNSLSSKGAVKFHNPVNVGVKFDF
jgi:hypothetical protein